MRIRGIKGRIFFQLWALFFLSLLLTDILVLFILADPSLFPFAMLKSERLSHAAELTDSIEAISLQDEKILLEQESMAKHAIEQLYKNHRKIQNISFAFVIVGSFLFATLGTYQLTRSYFKPLQRLAKRAETYQDESYPFFSVRKEDNEFSLLSTSLNNMLHRIADDQQILKETIVSLEIANAELKKAQNDVIRAEKLATVGRLTSGIAHEIGNPIGIVLGYLDLLKQAELSMEDRIDFITRSEKEITRINDIIRKLLDMSRKNTEEEKPVSIHWLLEDLLSVFKCQPFAADISFSKEFDASEDQIIGDPDQLRQVYLNLLLNSTDALKMIDSTKKKIVMRTKVLVGDASVHLDPQKKYIDTSIHDNGPGFQNDHLDRIFDPFFTTKEPGKGTGLGLSVASMIVEKFSGRLIAANDEKMGAAVHVFFPLP